MHQLTNKKLHKILPLAAAGGLWVLTALLWNFTFDLNDDLLIEHLMSGLYTGEGELYSIQNLFPLSALLGLLYRLTGSGFSWYGAFLILCQFGSLALILTMTRSWTRGEEGKRLPLLAFLLFAGLGWYHLVYIQYSVTVGMLCMGVCAYLLGMRRAKGIKDMLRIYAPVGLLLGLSYAIRSEMTLFMLPLVGLSFLFRAGEIYPLGKPSDQDKKIPGLVTSIFLALVVLLIPLAILEGIDRAGYGTADWREFRNFFDARTQLYDFNTIPDTNEDAAFYESIGLTPEESVLIGNYNFALDDKIDADLMWKIADYAGEKAREAEPLKIRLRKALWDYRHTFTDKSAMPWNLVPLFFYGLVFVMELMRYSMGRQLEKLGNRRVQADGGRFAISMVRLVSLFAVRSALWIYLEYNHRPVVRLTHSIAMAESLILLWMLYHEREAGEEKRAPQEKTGLQKTGDGQANADPAEGTDLLDKAAATADRIRNLVRTSVVLVLVITACIQQLTAIRAQAELRMEVNRPYGAYLTYCQDHPENLFFTDVYSTVNFSEEIFGTRTGRTLNHDLLGGWAAGSPLYRKKLEGNGASSVMEGLLMDKSCFITREDYDTNWLAEFYRSRGVEVEILLRDQIPVEAGSSGQKNLLVYQLERK